MWFYGVRRVLYLETMHEEANISGQRENRGVVTKHLILIMVCILR